MAKKKDNRHIEVIAIADEIVFQDKTIKQGTVFKLDTADPVAEGLLVGGAVVDHAEYKKQMAELEAAEAEQKAQQEKAEAEAEDEDGSR